jgi:periplasmic divalent cation tolerance protein
VSESRAALIYTITSDADNARSIAGTLLDERLIACANIVGEIESVFVWEGARQSSRECAVLFKTTTDALEAAVARLGELHPYDTPAIVANACSHAHASTLEWLALERVFRFGPSAP